jgi:pSer/pThr/pTyr-binding forkhead associated (FHA) protein
MGSRGCSRCGAPLSLDRAETGAPSLAEAVGETVDCATCGEAVGVDQRFCGGCGARMPPVGAEPTPAAPRPVPAVGSARANNPSGLGKKTLFFGAMQATRAKLVLIKGDGLDGVSFTLAGDEHIAGREDAALLFEEDPFLSPQHANFFYRSGDLVVRDEGSVNGVFIRIRGSHAVAPGDRFLVGEQVLEMQKAGGDGEPTPEPDGTYFYASPRRGGPYRLIQILRGGETGLAFFPTSEVVSLGREDNDINFPDDPFISGHHAQVSFAGSQASLSDLGSKNGTFVKVKKESRLQHGDYVFMGQQLLRVEIV